MKLGDLFENWGIKRIHINMLGLADLEFNPESCDQEAAWELYIELITRITTQDLEDNTGVEEVALESIYSIFDITRQLLKEKGRKSSEFSKIAIVMLNGIIRPFTAKWHRIIYNNEFNADNKKIFRAELKDLQENLKKITKMLLQIAKISNIENVKDIEGLLINENR